MKVLICILLISQFCLSQNILVDTNGSEGAGGGSHYVVDRCYIEITTNNSTPLFQVQIYDMTLEEKVFLRDVLLSYSSMIEDGNSLVAVDPIATLEDAFKVLQILIRSNICKS